MAAGKTTVGELLADRIGWRFIDFDREIGERTGLSAGRLIRERGEAALRDLEAELTAEIAGVGEVVLAPGGGWVTRPELAARLGSGTVMVWLRIGVDEAVRRAADQAEAAVGDRIDRPLLGPPNGRRERARELLESREPLYARAEVVVDVEDREPDVVVNEIVRRLGLHGEADER